MKILLAADGSPYTEKALAFIATHRELAGAEGELMVLHVQPPLPPGVKRMLDAAAVASYYQQESEAVLEPIRQLLLRREMRHRCTWILGNPVEEILRAIENDQPQLVVMGTHGRGFVGRALMGSVAQQVLERSQIPVLLVK